MAISVALKLPTTLTLVQVATNRDRKEVLMSKIEIGDLIYIEQFKSVYLVGHPRVVPSCVLLTEGYKTGDCTLAKLGSGLIPELIGGCNALPQSAFCV